MKIIVGLGNPGERYKNTYHNLGFLILDQIKEKKNFPPFSYQKRFKAKISQKRIRSEKILLVKPQTFMNRSGESISRIYSFFNLSLDDFIVIHDDYDLPWGEIRLSFKAGAGGHKGVESIISSLGRKDFLRIRLGIFLNSKKTTERYVLSKINLKLKKELEEIGKRTIDLIMLLLKEGRKRTMSSYREKIKNPHSAGDKRKIQKRISS